MGMPGANCVPGNYTKINQCDGFDPGVYVIVRDPASAGGVAEWTATGDPTDVLFYFTCSNDLGEGILFPDECAINELGASLSVRGAMPPLVGRTTPGPHEGFAIMVDPNNAAPVNFASNSHLDVTGAFGP